MTPIKHIDKQSKGRNGWFHPTDFNVSPRGGDHMGGNGMVIEIWSKRKDGNPPIDLYLNAEDAESLAREILAIVTPESLDTDNTGSELIFNDKGVAVTRYGNDRIEQP